MNLIGQHDVPYYIIIYYNYYKNVFPCDIFNCFTVIFVANAIYRTLRNKIVCLARNEKKTLKFQIL